MPGIRLNFAKKGASLSLGGRGATVNLSGKGVRQTVGIPGTGMSYSDYKAWGKPEGVPLEDTAPERAAETLPETPPETTIPRSTRSPWTLAIITLFIGVLIGWLAR